MSSEFIIRFNVISGGVGHVNVTLIDRTTNDNLTIGANNELLGFNNIFEGLGHTSEGVVREEGDLLHSVNRPFISRDLPVTEQQYNLIRSHAESMLDKTFDYAVVGYTCAEFGEYIYALTGHPGQMGDLFSEADRRQSVVGQNLVWLKIQGNHPWDLLPGVNHQPGYIPTGPIEGYIPVIVGEFANLPFIMHNNFDGLSIPSVEALVNWLNPSRPLCFLAGTMIEMWDGTRKPIELIKKGDEVVSYDKDGNLVKGIVTQTFTNQATHVLDWFETGVTPGHVTYCSEGEFEGSHVPLIDILMSDGGVMQMDGTKIRANTNWEVGSEMDRKVHVMAAESLGPLVDLMRVSDLAEIRLGNRFIDEDGKEWTLKDLIDAQATNNNIEFGYGINDEGYVQRLDAEGNIDPDSHSFPFLWPFGDRLPRPWDHVVVQRSKLSLGEIVKADEWESMRPTIIDRERFEYALKKFKKLPDHVDKSNPHDLPGMQLQLYPDTMN